MRKKILFILLFIFTGTALLIFILPSGLYFEAYPHISTCYASSKFSENKFVKIKSGDNIHEVEKNIGRPFELMIVKNTDAFGMPYINKKIPNTAKYIAYYSHGKEFGHFDWECFMIVYDADSNVVCKRNGWVDGD